VCRPASALKSRLRDIQDRGGLTMTTFHSRTEDLLKVQLASHAPTRKRIEDAAHRCGLRLPPSYLEWAALKDAAEVLHRYSSSDKFWFVPASEHVIATGFGDALLFCEESQGNFSLAVLLEPEVDDPPVAVADYTRQRWIQYCDRFSDAIFTQVFDWQHQLFVNQDGSTDIDYYEEFELRDHERALNVLRGLYQEHPTTHWYMETADDATTWRFSTPADERILLSNDPGRSLNWISVYAPPANRQVRCRALVEQIKSQI
jgi:hypothetical protein